jgi:DNA mismatch endonuclease (patch repair protein)
VRPRSNTDWWEWKVQTNKRRDADTDRALEELGYSSLRIWEHVPPEVAADLVIQRLADLGFGRA